MYAQLEPGLVVGANRLKDQKALPYLQSLRDELRRQADG